MSQPPHKRRSSGRFALVLVASLLLHALLFWFSRRMASDLPPREPPNERVTISLQEKKDERPPEPVGQGERPDPSPKPRARREPSAPDAPAPLAGPTPPGPEASPPPTGPAPDLGRLKLLDPSVIGRSIARGMPQLPVDEHLQLGGDDHESDADQAARIKSRLDDGIADAMGSAAAASGYASACDDGVDNNIDGEIDCADPGCRQLSVCDLTGIYGEDEPAGIPDGAGELTRGVRVVQEGRIRKLSLTVDVMHASPGDLQLTLVAPDGRRASLRRADRADFTFKKAYYVRAFLGSAPSGEWKLVVEDRHAGVRGVLRRWRMYVTS